MSGEGDSSSTSRALPWSKPRLGAEVEASTASSSSSDKSAASGVNSDWYQMRVVQNLLHVHTKICTAGTNFGGVCKAKSTTKLSVHASMHFLAKAEL